MKTCPECGREALVHQRDRNFSCGACGISVVHQGNAYIPEAE